MPDEFPAFDLYAELEVSERASVETIQAAYRSLQLRNHPDRVGDGAGDRAVRLNVARDWLTDADRRARYDAHVAAVRARQRATMSGLDGEADQAVDGEGLPDDHDDAGEAEPGRRGGALHLLRRHLRIDPWRLGRIWVVGLAALGAVAVVPGVVAPQWLRVAAALAAVVVLLGLGLGAASRGQHGLWSRLVRWVGVLLGWLALAALAVRGVTALAELAAGDRMPDGFADVVVPVVAATALLSVFAVRRRRATAEMAVDDFLEMTPREFEEAVGDILGRHGYRLVLTGGPGDLAADLMGTDPDGLPAVVQCKRYAPGHPVGSRDVQLLIAMGMRHHGAERLVLVTTSDFTDPARDLADEHGVELISGADLEDLTR